MEQEQAHVKLFVSGNHFAQCHVSSVSAGNVITVYGLGDKDPVTL